MTKSTADPATAAGRNKTDRRNKPDRIVIKGCGGHFNGVYDVDELILKLMAFVFLCGVTALIFL